VDGKQALALPHTHKEFPQMVLLQDIKLKRAREKKKQPIRQDDFTQVSSIVKEYGLDESFLSVLNEMVGSETGKNLRVRAKAPMQPPLFSLATKEEYSITMSILGKVHNPYLKFAQSPEEILLSEDLYRLNPSIPPEKLTRFHFETLLLHEYAKARTMKLNMQATDADYPRE
jgi:hypothetical protein